MKIKHLQGWLTKQALDNPEWLNAWAETIKECEKDNTELAIFKIPKDSSAIEEIEYILQTSFIH